MSDTLPFQCQTIAGSKTGPRLLITGGVHGDEFEPMPAIRKLCQTIEPGTLSGHVMLIPVVNEPAFLRGQRCGDDGLDLARTCPGRTDGSATERIAFVLSKMISEASFYIDLHTGGSTLQILPMTGYMLHPKRAILEQQRRMARAFNLPLIWGTDPGLNGRSLSVARDSDVPAIYAEFGGSSVCDPTGVNAYTEGCLNVMATLGMIQRPLPASQIQHEFEDDRAGSGYMQTANPSPFTGFYEPAVEPGDWLEAGDAIGTVSDVGGSRVETVYSRVSGLVLVLATFSRVREGDSLAVIIDGNGRKSGGIQRNL